MKILLFFFFLLCATMGVAQQLSESISEEKQNTLSRFQVGLQYNQISNDFGMGLNLTSPHFFNRHVSIRLSGNVQWLHYISASTKETDVSPYGNYKLGVSGISGYLCKSIFIYGEGGLVVMTPNRKFSDKSILSGGYGLFGFSFLVNKGISYYIELGGMGTGAIAEKSVFKPIYANGFTTSVGIRKSL